ncbi:MAG: DUF1987 domain-containing protein [Bacteroidales bacterium]|nr:DUF1987 domain-containing protein [Bacteroidales bacterium]
MEDIHIQASKNVYIQPQVDFYLSEGKCLIKGESFLEETAKFYAPLVDWIRNYPKYGSKIDFTFSLTYFNTSTSKWILMLLAELKKLENNGLEINTTWYYHEDDLDMRDDIADYMSDTGLNIELVPFK